MPGDFCLRCGNEIPVNVYLRVRNCDAWCGLYRHDKACIEGLGRMMSFYGIKPFNIVLLRYNGCGSFSMEIFDDYHIEIDYAVRPISLKKSSLIQTTADNKTEDYSMLDLEKMSARFWYNSFGDSRSSYSVLIQDEHIEKSNKIEVAFVL